MIDQICALNNTERLGDQRKNIRDRYGNFWIIKDKEGFALWIYGLIKKFAVQGCMGIFLYGSTFVGALILLALICYYGSYALFPERVESMEKQVVYDKWKDLREKEF